jgi:hypothetical protein
MFYQRKGMIKEAEATGRGGAQDSNWKRQLREGKKKNPNG